MTHRCRRNLCLRLRCKQIANPRIQFVAELIEQTRLHFGRKLHSRIYQPRPQRPLIEVPDDRQRSVRTFAPITAAQRDTPVVEANPCTGHQLRMHQDEPAVGIVLRCASLARYIPANTETRSDRCTSTAIHDIAHHIDQRPVRCSRQRPLRRSRLELREHVAIVILDARHHARLKILAVVRDRAIRRHHFLDRHRARAQCKRRHGGELAVAYAHRAREPDHLVRPNLLHQLRGDAVARISERVAQRHRLAARRRVIVRTPDLAALQRYFDRLIDEGIRGLRAICKSGAVHKRLERRTGLTP